MTAGILWLGLKLLGVRKVGLYDEVSVTYISLIFPKTKQLHGPVLDWVCRSRVKRYKEIRMIVIGEHIAINLLLASELESYTHIFPC